MTYYKLPEPILGRYVGVGQEPVPKNELTQKKFIFGLIDPIFRSSDPRITCN